MLTLLSRIAAHPANDDVSTLADLVARLRPSHPSRMAQATTNLRRLVQLLSDNPIAAAGLRQHLLHVLSTRRHTTLYTDTGILPSDGFFTELFRRLSFRILPPAIDPLYLSDCLEHILSTDTDYIWMRAIHADDWLALFDVVASSDASAIVDSAERQTAHQEILEAIQTLSHRISAMGLEPSLVRIHPDLENFASPFMVQNVEVHRFLEGALRRFTDIADDGLESKNNDANIANDDAAHLLVMLDQCDEVVTRIRKKSLQRGTSVGLTYLLVRLGQSIDRLRRLLMLVDPVVGAIVGPIVDPVIDGTAPTWSDERRRAALSLALDLVQAHNQKYALRELFADNIDLLARNVTENASQTGEHYIAEDRRESVAMLRSSAGAGVVVGFMALLKILAAALHRAPLVEAFLFSANYSFGFMLIHLLHFTVATKQPAMTAARIAANLSSKDSRTIDTDSLAALMVSVLRTQFIAICGNLLTVFPTALLIALTWLHFTGHHLVSPDKARRLLHDIDPFSTLALFQAAIAGVCLFLAGLISGYFDNRALYTRLSSRILRLRSWQRCLGAERHARAAQYLEKNLGGLMGNFFFGILLGTIGTLGDLLGLPIDIRHITFSASNLATAWVGLDYQVSTQMLLTSLCGVLLIGLTNLLVSFGLALFVALRSRKVRFKKGWLLLQSLVFWFLRRPQDFFFAPKSLPLTAEATSPQ